MNLSFSRKGKLHYAILYLLFFIGLGLLWQWLFRIAFKVNYVQQCLDLGPSLFIFNALLAAIWSDFVDDADLISPNPPTFAAAWLFVAARISIAFANATRRAFFLREDAPPKWDRLREGITCNIVLYVVLGLICVWLLFAIPFLYFVFLVSASPVRLSLQARDAVVVSDPELVLGEEGTQKEDRASFSEKPVASAFALSSLMFLALKLIVNGISVFIPA
jgi:hypothetical protein